MSNFSFLQGEWAEIHEAAARAEALAFPDPRAGCFYARRALEIAVEWLYKHDSALKLPYQTHPSALIHEPTFRQTVEAAVFNKARVIKDLGNQAVHSMRPVPQADAVMAVRELFHVCFWLARTYAREERPADGVRFDEALLPRTSEIPTATLKQLQELEQQLAERDDRLMELLVSNAELDEELKRLRTEVGQAKAANSARADTHDYSEAQTRDFYIDLLLKEAGWALGKAEDREFEVSGMPNNQGIGFVDYVLWGDDGKPLGLVEAKHTKRDPRAGRQQAKLYADCLERQFGQRPVIFYSNGYEHWVWDDANYPPRSIQGFLKKDELELLIQRRATRHPLAEQEIDPWIVERYYQIEAIRRIAEGFENDHERKALIVMATGAGKTRTAAALCDVLMRANWVKRVLFLADRVALVNQTVNAFKQHLPASSPVNLVTEKEKDGRVYVCTYPTMMGLIDETRDGQWKFGVGHFDLTIIDEAHRSVYQKYGAIFDYFDSLLLGLTATPKDEVDRNTYRLFDLENGVPTAVYELEAAVEDGYLVPPKAVSVPLRFQREGISYDQLSEQEQEQWDALEWSEDGQIPDRVEPAALNQWLFNEDTVDKVLEHLMTHGQTVAGGDRLGKTIIFGKNHEHAEFIAQRFDVNYPHYRGEFARVIDFKVEYAQSLIDDFSNPEKAPHIAISVDMLDTGIDIPEVVNLVFFKLVRSKTKFWQMVGRGTRLRPDLFGPGKQKEFFYIFDYCQNLEFFSQNPETTEGAAGPSLGTKVFTARVDLVRAVDGKWVTQESQEGTAVRDARMLEHAVRGEVAALLREQVAGMNVENFMVRPRRRLVEKYREPATWANRLTEEERQELTGEVAKLPTAVVDPDEEAKRFDLLILRLQLCLLRGDRGFVQLREQVRTIAGLLEEQASIPMVRGELELILEIQTDAWWEDVTAAMLETARKRLRALVKLIEKAKRQLVYTDFEDLMGDERWVDLGGLGTAGDFSGFVAKARQFLRDHDSHVAIQKLRLNKPLTALDLEELERFMVEAGVGSAEDIERAKRGSEGLGLFIRSLVGLDREAAKEALGEFLSGKATTANQIRFVNMIVDYLTEHGVMDPVLLYRSPFTDINAQGPEGVFESPEVDELVAVLGVVRERAIA